VKNSIIWDITPCSPLKGNRCFGGKCRLQLQCQKKTKQETIVKLSGNKHVTLLVNSFQAGFLLAYSSTLKMEATCCSEILVDFHRATRRYIPEGRTLQKTFIFEDFTEVLVQIVVFWLVTSYILVCG
jgi:hypothetical protein